MTEEEWEMVEELTRIAITNPLDFRFLEKMVGLGHRATLSAGDNFLLKRTHERYLDHIEQSRQGEGTSIPSSTK